MSRKGEPLERSTPAALDGTPEELADHHAGAKHMYLLSRVKRSQHAEYLRRYLGEYLRVLERYTPGVRELLVSDWVEEPEELTGLLSEGGGHEHLFRLVNELLEREPSIKSRLAGRWMDEFTEEVARRAPSTESHAIVELLNEIEIDWRNRA